jgi:[ribosomal protein S18]-alanine N-acetyltransferase
MYPTSGVGRVVSSRSRNAVSADLEVVASWIASQRECELWAGPTVPFPLERSALPDQIGMAGAINVALDDDQGIVAFGQIVPRPPDRAHLARVIVRPGARRRGLGRVLVETLLARAEVAGLSQVTLNVYRDNVAAAALYAELGFARGERPDGDPASPGIWFMQRSIDSSAMGRGAQ